MWVEEVVARSVVVVVVGVGVVRFEAGDQETL